MRNKYRRLNHDARLNYNAFGGKTVMEYFDSPREVELFLEINSGSLFDEDYSSLPDELKKKYIGMGYDLSSDMIKNSSPSVLKYYADKKIEDIKQKRLADLTPEDIALLNAPMFASLKNELKKKYSEGLSVDGGTRFELRGSQDGKVGRFISLYGLDEVFEMLPTSTNVISLVGDGPKGTPFKLPKAITRLKNVYSLSIQNNAISELPDFICELEDLSHLGLVNNPNLTKLPECLADLENMTIMNISGSGITKLPKKLEEKMEEVGGGIYNVHGF
jgi:Leucine-rich repeat (LRR) protein